LTRDWSSSELVESLLRAARDGRASQAKLDSNGRLEIVWKCDITSLEYQFGPVG
jgi:hypothetical protein